MSFKIKMEAGDGEGGRVMPKATKTIIIYDKRGKE